MQPIQQPGHSLLLGVHLASGPSLMGAVRVMYGCAVQALRAWVTALLPAGLTLVRKQLKETVASAPHGLVAGCFNLVDALLAPLLKTGEQS